MSGIMRRISNPLFEEIKKTQAELEKRMGVKVSFTEAASYVAKKAQNNSVPNEVIVSNRRKTKFDFRF